ncbi:hypothetical protein [Streptomyces sp. NPDC018693]|uniref:DUF7919 family protein n=1 Tax=unclassified Streptomyces TaxID=2593676 RepID=UPI0037A11063
MTECIDLSDYDYMDFPLPLLCVGWLGRDHGIQQGNQPPMSREVVDAFERASLRVVSRTLGEHDCAFCPEEAAATGNGEYRYYAHDGLTYTAPVMVRHYVRDHGYRLPAPLQQSLLDTRPLPWDTRAERLAGLVADPAEDIIARCLAVSDLVHWQDRRTVDALELAALDEELVDLVGREIGRSLKEALEGTPGAQLSTNEGDFPLEVRAGLVGDRRDPAGQARQSNRDRPRQVRFPSSSRRAGDG